MAKTQRNEKRALRCLRLVVGIEGRWPLFRHVEIPVIGSSHLQVEPVSIRIAVDRVADETATIGAQRKAPVLLPADVA